MNWFVSLENADERALRSVGGKGFALSLLARNGFTVPKSLCITTQSYEHFITKTGLRERILLELSRKDFNDMRWEELWDASLRIRNMFVTEPMPNDLLAALRDVLTSCCGKEPVVVRSSAADEDTSTASFAGHPRFLCEHPGSRIHSRPCETRLGFSLE